MAETVWYTTAPRCIHPLYSARTICFSGNFNGVTPINRLGLEE